MQIQLNGKCKDVVNSCTVSQLLESLNQHPQRVAVEINREIVNRGRYDVVELHEGDEVEVLHYVGGGLNTQRNVLL